MKLEDLKLTIVKDEGAYVAWMEQLPGITVQVDHIEDIPKEIAKVLKIMLEYGMEQGVHYIVDAKDF